MAIVPAALAGGVLAGGASCLVGAALDGARGSRLRGWPPWLLALGRLVLAVAGAELGAGGRGRGGGMRAVITAACGGGIAARAVAKVAARADGVSVAPAARREAAEREGAMAGEGRWGWPPLLLPAGAMPADRDRARRAVPRGVTAATLWRRFGRVGPRLSQSGPKRLGYG